jgi:membrane protease YdiL (CAAX protease family)
MLARGFVAWLLLSGAFVALDVVGLADGLALPVPLIVALVGARVIQQAPWAQRNPRRLVLAVATGCAVLAGAARALQLRWFDLSPSELAATLLLAAGLSLLLAADRVRALLLRPLGLDPASPVHAVVAVAIVLTVLTSIVLFSVLQREPATSIALYPTDSMVSLVSDVAIALAGVGFMLTRDFRTAGARLDLRPLRVRHLAWALGAATLFHLVVGAMEWTESIVLPGFHALEERFDYEFVGIPRLAGAALVSVTAGVGEEILFRGALQPRIGIVASAVLFAMLHVQYQVPGVLMILAVGLALGVLKRWTSTTFTVVVHVVYDLGAFLLDFYA